MLSDSEWREQPQESVEVSEFFNLFEKECGIQNTHIWIDTDDCRQWLRTFASHALAHASHSSGNVIATLKLIIAELDRKISEQLNPIMHYPAFQRLEATWRGLWYVCSQIDFIEDAKLKVFNVSKDTLINMSNGPNRESPLYRKVYTDEFATFGGEPFGAIVVDFQFDSSGVNFWVLNHLAWIGSTAHTAFIVSAEPAMFGLTSFAEMNAPREIRVVSMPLTGHLWETFRKNESARYLSIALPRILLRRAYGRAKTPVSEFEFEEDVEGKSKFLWGNPGWALGDSIARAFNQDGWFAALCGSEAPGLVQNLTTEEVLTDDGMEVIGPTETSVSYDRERELTQLGFTVLLQRKGFADVALNSVQNPFLREVISQTGLRFREISPDRDLRTVLCVSRIAQHIPIVWNTSSGHLPDATNNLEARPYEAMEHSLQHWLDAYVAPKDAALTIDKPLRKAIVQIYQRDPHYYCADAVLELWLGYLFVGNVGPIKVTVRLENAFDRPAARPVVVSRLPLAESKRVPNAYQNSPIEPENGNGQHALAPFQLYAIEPSRDPIQVVSNLTQVLGERAWILQHIVLGPLNVRALVAADLPIEQLIDFITDESSRLVIDITHCVLGAKFNSPKLAFLAAYPSRIVRGLSADLAILNDRYMLRLLDPLAMLDPGKLILTRPSKPIQCRFDIVILEDTGHEDRV